MITLLKAGFLHPLCELSSLFLAFPKKRWWLYIYTLHSFFLPVFENSKLQYKERHPLKSPVWIITARVCRRRAETNYWRHTAVLLTECEWNLLVHVGAHKLIWSQSKITLLVIFEGRTQHFLYTLWYVSVTETRGDSEVDKSPHGWAEVFETELNIFACLCWIIIHQWSISGPSIPNESNIPNNVNQCQV